MSKRLTNREKLLHKLQQLTDHEVEDVLAYVSILECTEVGVAERGTLKDQKVFQSNASSEDDLLALLSGAYENQRACQVFEWETARRKSEIKAGRYVR
ncbi:MAG: hypothetical protein JST85_16020 [Acidobacteria bacterium]|nr:hypothetical protein [Acidobacteriota bacterium]